MKSKLLLLALTGLSAVRSQALLEILPEQPDLSSLAGFVGQYPEIIQALTTADGITILAPNNAAFEKLLATPEGQAAAEDKEMLGAILTYHVLTDEYTSDEIPETIDFFHTMLMDSAYTNVTDGQVVGAVKKEDKVTFNGGGSEPAMVVTADVKFDGGVIHIIDSVLMIPMSISETAEAAGLTALTAALAQADLVETVESLKDVTVFAPNNEAFAAVSDVVDDITPEMITAVLTYHVVPGAAELSNGMTLTTVNGEEVMITVEDGTIKVNNATVVMADVLVANGVVHVIDSVLMPENLDAPTNSTSTGSATSTRSGPAATATDGDDEDESSTGTPAVQTDNAAAGTLQPGVFGFGALACAGMALLAF